MNINDRIYQDICDIVGIENAQMGEEMKKHTTFRIGGKADCFVTPDTIGKTAEIIRYCNKKEIPYFVIGNGSNLLVSDKGYRGVIIQILRNQNRIRVEDNKIIAESGALLSVLSKQAAKQGFTGLEFAAGIPGSLGGAVTMNAGAYGGEMKDVISQVTVLDQNGELMILEKENLELGYRTSVIAKNQYIVMETELELEKGNEAEIQNKMDTFNKSRIEKQPLEFPSAGSTFKRPEGHFAGKLIMDAGLAGFSIGDAQISSKHCGFLINKGNATAAEVMELVKYVQRTVKEKYGVFLELEIKLLGDFT